MASRNAVIDLDGSAVVLITMIANQLGTSGSLTFQRRHGLTSPEWRVLAVVAARPGASGIEVAQLLGIDKAAVSRTLGTLSHRGLIVIGRREEGKKQQAVILTDSGRDAHDAAIQTAFERETQLLSCLPVKDRAELLRLLRRVKGGMPEMFALAERPAIAVSAPIADTASPPLSEQLTHLATRAADLERALAESVAENTALRRRIADASPQQAGADQEGDQTP